MFRLLRQIAAGLGMALALGAGAESVVLADATTRPAVANATRPSVAATTRPAGAPRGLRPGPAYVIQRYKSILSQIQLTEDQKTKVAAIMARASQGGLDLSDSLANAQNPDRLAILTKFARQIRQDLAGVLSGDQLKTLDQKFGPGIGPGPGGRGNGPAAVLDIVQQALGKLQLSEDQKQQIKEALSETRDRLAAIRNTGGANAQQDLQQVRKDLRDELQMILSPDEMQAFTSSMQQTLEVRPAGNAGRGQGRQPREIQDNKPLDLQPAALEAGSATPDIGIIETNGRVFNPSQYKGRVVVLEFGSMSCPVFRSHAAELEKLKQSENGRAFFLIIYTREQFPAGEKNVERNRDEGVNIPEAGTLEERKAQAMETQRELRLTIPMAVDSMDDAVSTAYGAFPNGAVVIGKDGKIAAHQQWTNPDNLKEAIDDAFGAVEHGAAH